MVTVFGVIGMNMETVRFLCSDFDKSRVMQGTALFLNLARERIKDYPSLPVVIVANCQGMLRGRPLTERTTVGRGGERRWGGTPTRTQYCR